MLPHVHWHTAITDHLSNCFQFTPFALVYFLSGEIRAIGSSESWPVWIHVVHEDHVSKRMLILNISELNKQKQTNQKIIKEESIVSECSS